MPSTNCGPCRATRRACLAAQARPGTRAVPSPGPVSSGPCRAWAVPCRPCLGRATGPRAFCSSIGHRCSSTPSHFWRPPADLHGSLCGLRAQRRRIVAAHLHIGSSLGRSPEVHSLDGGVLCTALNRPSSLSTNLIPRRGHGGSV